MQATSNDSIVSNLSHYGCIAVEGDDAGSFLQGQLTCDLRRIDSGISLLAGYCNPQGRLLACLRLVRHADRYLLRLPGELTASILQRLRLFVLRARVDLHDASHDQARIGLSGPTSVELLKKYLIDIPASVGQFLDNDNCAIVRVPGEPPRFELYGPASRLQALWQELAPVAQPVDAETWNRTEVLAGLPEIHPVTQNTFIPQMLNLDLLGGIAFDKGCYVGQEIVARTHYLGRLKRRMYRLYSELPVSLQPGDTLDDDAESRPAGQIVRAVTIPGTGVEMLAVMTMAELPESGVLRLRRDDTVFTARLMPLPYPLPAGG